MNKPMFTIRIAELSDKLRGTEIPLFTYDELQKCIEVHSHKNSRQIYMTILTDEKYMIDTLRCIYIDGGYVEMPDTEQYKYMAYLCLPRDSYFE